MVERVYVDGEFKAGRRSFNIYCTICGSLVFICKNTIKCANKHLNECIAKTAKRHIAYSNFIQKNIGKFFGLQICADLQSHFCSHQHNLAPEVAEKIQ
jgi:hypothetical protein